MSKIDRFLAAHPLAEVPYSEISFSHFDGKRKPIYHVKGLDGNAGAKLALARAFERSGGTCFYCRKKMKAAELSQNVTRDHIRPKSKGGSDYLHNLVIACGGCNKNKGDKELSKCRRDATERYLKALDAHIIKCLENL